MALLTTRALIVRGRPLFTDECPFLDAQHNYIVTIILATLCVQNALLKRQWNKATLLKS